MLDLGHLRLTTTKRLGLQRFAPRLKRLCLRQNLLTKIRSKDIGVLTELEDLDLYDNSIEKISGLDALTKLESLDLSFNNIHHISNVSHLGECKTIYFVQNKISRRASRRPAGCHRAFARVARTRRQPSAFDRKHRPPQQPHPALAGQEQDHFARRHFDADESARAQHPEQRITKLHGLEKLVNLQELYLSHNGLTKIEGLENNTKLTTLDIGANMIERIENVAHLNQLEEFWANDNRIEDLNDVDRQLGPNNMPNLETVYLEGNPAQKKEGPRIGGSSDCSCPRSSRLTPPSSAEPRQSRYYASRQRNHSSSFVPCILHRMFGILLYHFALCMDDCSMRSVGCVV